MTINYLKRNYIMALKKNQPGYSEAKDKNGKTYWKKTSKEKN